MAPRPPLSENYNLQMLRFCIKEIELASNVFSEKGRGEGKGREKEKGGKWKRKEGGQERRQERNKQATVKGKINRRGRKRSHPCLPAARSKAPDLVAGPTSALGLVCPPQRLGAGEGRETNPTRAPNPREKGL